LAARSWLSERARDAGLDVDVDPAGNLWMTRWGMTEATILMGSHIDTVPNAGRYDGCLGVLGGLEALRMLAKAGRTRTTTIRLVAWIEEEGTTTGRTLLGSSLFTGEVPREAATGVGSTEIEGFPDLLARDTERSASWDGFSLDDVRAYIELHVEQGPVLNREGVTIGVVDGIVGYRSGTVVFAGIGNHAGTTPMSHRSDALAAGSRAVLAVRELALAAGLTATVGQVVVHPNASNVIAGEVRLVYEARGLDDEALDLYVDDLAARLAEIACDEKATATITPLACIQAAPMAPELRTLVREVASDMGLAHQQITSGALHDAAPLSRRVPTGMIFVPSIDGISHSPAEQTSLDDCLAGIGVLAEVLDRISDLPIATTDLRATGPTGPGLPST
jgi:hydantoinase/carbamoylase family amidase